MNTSAEAVQLLQEALAKTKAATGVINDLIVAHDYQDVAGLVTQSTAALLESAVALLQSNDEDALDAMERADDLLDTAWSIIDRETDEE
ncbi:MAG: hypothetical protein H7175_19390 [Burkholderiales bacterium]|nr:hypothetical protein [Anaerolineae bacterium]